MRSIHWKRSLAFTVAASESTYPSALSRLCLPVHTKLCDVAKKVALQTEAPPEHKLFVFKGRLLQDTQVCSLVWHVLGAKCSGLLGRCPGMVCCLQVVFASRQVGLCHSAFP